MDDKVIDNSEEQAAATTQGDNGINLVSVHQGDKNTDTRSDKQTEALRKQIEESEKLVQAVLSKVGSIASRMAGLEHCEEPHHFDMMKKLVMTKAANNEPAYLEIKNKMGLA